MAEVAPIYAAFLGAWELVPESCDYQQGEPPRAGRVEIADDAGRLVFTVSWTDTAGASHQMRFSGRPDGEREPFAGGELADALSIEAPSPRELTSVAFWRGKRRMVAQRQLDATKLAMRVTQVVFLPDGTHLANVAIYRKALSN